MLKKWINFIVHLTNKIFRLKAKMAYTNIILTIVYSIILIGLEALMAIISLPLYLFLKPTIVEEHSSKVMSEGYSLRRKLTITALLVLVVAVFLKAAIALVISIYIAGNMRT
jgi:hypothetical protein